MKISHPHTGLLLLFIVLSVLGCSPSEIARAEKSSPTLQHSLKVGTVYGRQTYYIGPNGPTGFEYELAKGFAEYLNLELEMFAFLSFDELTKQLEAGELDIVATGNGHLNEFNVNGPNQTHEDKDPSGIGPKIWGPTYQSVSHELVYLQGQPRPRSVNDLTQAATLVAGSSKIHSLMEHYDNLTNLALNPIEDRDSEELLVAVANGELPYAVANSNELSIVRRRYPELSVGFTLKESLPVAWQLAKQADDRLEGMLFEYIANLRATGAMARLEDRYFGHVRNFDFVDTKAFISAVKTILPNYIEMFKTHSGELDWRLLAALSYQESHWDPKAVSRTGVRGMMMLTRETAKDWKVQSRLNPTQSIDGGARYFSSLTQRVPARIQSPDRIWMALAAYNIGLGHLEDARVLTQRHGGNPDIWIDVKQRLPLLQQKRYYSQTRYGYARGNEALQYVENIRRYYDTLVWLDEQSTN